MQNNELKHLLIAYKSTVIGLQTTHDEILSLFGVVASLPKCKNYVNGQCTECELNHHKECNG
jgi:hypothetical protein